MGCCSSNEDFAGDDAEMVKEEARIEGKIDYKIGSSQFIEMTKWPIIILDTTGSMEEAVALNSMKKRDELVKDICRIISWRLASVDTADRKQAQSGVPLITFNMIDGGVDRGFLHPTNFDAEWRNIEFHGRTHIMDGWRKMLTKYEQNFTDRPQDTWPLLLCLIITDGELQDGVEFEQHLKHVHGRAFVEIAVVGYGEDHDRACSHYAKISKKHPHVRCTPFSSLEDADIIVNQLLSMIDPKLINKTSVPVSFTQVQLQPQSQMQLPYPGQQISYDSNNIYPPSAPYANYPPN